MRDVPNRRFTPADAMVFIAATAIGLGVCVTHAKNLRGPGTPLGPLTIKAYVTLTSFQLLSWSWAIVVARLIRPRPALWRVGRQPGFVACLAVGVFSLTRWCYEIPVWLHLRNKYNQINYLVATFIVAPWPSLVCPAIIVAWLTLALCGSWSPEASWIDRLGRAMGVFWLSASLVFACLWFDS
jgi:hypothetical protein